MDLREFRQHLWLVLILTALAFFFALVTNYYLDYDDAYITYRYAQRIAHGQGFTYNDGEKVLGTSTPLYTLLLSVPAFLGFDTPQISILIGLVCWIFLVFYFINTSEIPPKVI